MKKLMALVGGVALLIASFGSVGAGWTADPGPNPARCAGWYQKIQSGPGTPGYAQAAYYFERYNCQFVGEDDESETPSEDDGGTSVRR